MKTKNPKLQKTIFELNKRNSKIRKIGTILPYAEQLIKEVVESGGK